MSVPLPCGGVVLPSQFERDCYFLLSIPVGKLEKSLLQNLVLQQRNGVKLSFHDVVV